MATPSTFRRLTAALAIVAVAGGLLLPLVVMENRTLGDVLGSAIVFGLLMTPILVIPPALVSAVGWCSIHFDDWKRIGVWPLLLPLGICAVARITGVAHRPFLLPADFSDASVFWSSLALVCLLSCAGSNVMAHLLLRDRPGDRDRAAGVAYLSLALAVAVGVLFPWVPLA